MAGIPRTKRLNSILREVIADVIRKEVKHPNVHPLASVTEVDITKDLHQAKVYISVIGTDEEKQKTVDALNAAAGFIAVVSSKQVVMRYFPELTFIVDDTVDKQIRIQELVEEVQEERQARDD